MFVRPVAEVDLVSIESLQSSVGLEIGEVRLEEFLRGIPRGGCEHHVLLLPCKDEIHHAEHHDGTLRELTGPGEDFVPLRIAEYALDGPYLEGCELVFRVFREEVFYPFDGACLQIGLFLLDFRFGKGLDGCGVPYVRLIVGPFLEFEFVFLLHITAVLSGTRPIGSRNRLPSPYSQDAAIRRSVCLRSRDRRCLCPSPVS